MKLARGSIQFCISSCIGFSERTLPKIIPSLLECGILEKDILTVVGGCKNREEATLYGVKTILTPQNSFEYTPLIEIVEHNIERDYFFLLHDTCIAGGLFADLAHKVPVNKPEKVAMKFTPSMSIGLYQYDYLRRHAQRLMAIKNLDNSRDALQRWKQWGVPNEDYMLWKLADVPTHVYHLDRHGNDPWNYQGHYDIYETGQPRRLEYFPQLDLSKAKSNWQGVQPNLCIDL